jgi:hypothetical protein
MPHLVSQPEAQPAHEHQAKDHPQQRTRAQCQLGVVPAIFERLALRFFVVKVSPHRPPIDR